MSGHSKWSKIKRQKEATDKQKGTAFSKLSRLITLAVIEGGGITDPEHNVRLRLAVEKAKSFNMPKDNIDRAIEKGAGPGKDELKEVLYEAFGRNGSMFIIIASTNNQNRTTSEVRNILEKSGGKLGTQGSVSYLFMRSALARFSLSEKEESIFGFAEGVQASDIDKVDDGFMVYFPYEKIGSIKGFLGELKIQNLEVIFKPLLPLIVEDTAVKEKILDLIEALESLDDVHSVFTNIRL